MIIDCAQYREGVRQHEGKLDVEKAAACARDERRLRLGGRSTSPTEDELEQIAEVLRPAGAGGRGRRAASTSARSSRTTTTPSSSSSRRPATTRRQERVHFGEIDLFVAADYVIAVRHGEAASLEPARERLEGEHRELLRHGAPAVAWAILDKVVDDYEPGRRTGSRTTSRRSSRRSSTAARQSDRADLLPEARGDRVPPRGRRRCCAARVPRAGRVSRGRRTSCGRSSATSPITRAAIDEQVIAAARAPHLRPGGEPRAGQRPPERGRQADLGLGGDHRRADLHRRRLRDELPPHAGAATGSWGYPIALLVMVLLPVIVLHRFFKRIGWL